MNHSAPAYEIVDRRTPVVAAALHSGHLLRPEVAEEMGLAEDVRLREEDPHTDRLVPPSVTSVVVNRSRFEVDLNRPRERAVYRQPEDAWGLQVWSSGPDEAIIERSLQLYDRFYQDVKEVLAAVVERHRVAVVLDIHSYNHRRSGPAFGPEPAEENPEVNVGTAALDRSRWSSVVDSLIETLGTKGFDVRENLRFQGGHLSKWAAREFAGDVCVLAIEFRKSFMDEWTGEVDEVALLRIRQALSDCVPALTSSMRQAAR